MNNEEPLSKYILDSEKLEINNFNKKIKVAFLASFTINGLSESLKVKCSKKQISCNSYVAGYNQYNQEILDKKIVLYSFSPDITFLILDTRSIFGNLSHLHFECRFFIRSLICMP